MRLKLMLFDLWGTLFLHDGPHEGEPRDALRRKLVQHALAERGMYFDMADIASAFAQAAREHSAIHADARDIAAEARTVLYMRHLDETIASRLDDDGWRTLHRAVLAPALELRPALMPGAVEAVRAIKEMGVATCLVSNAGLTPGYVLREILSDYGVLPYLDHAIFSDEVELAKPAPAIFERALDEFGVAPGDAAFLGDQPVLDVLGPQSAGIWTVQLGDISEEGIVPHARISALGALVPALRSLALA
jgi:HAD superfamily hydrolase (TIGR01509 family)